MICSNTVYCCNDHHCAWIDHMKRSTLTDLTGQVTVILGILFILCFLAHFDSYIYYNMIITVFAGFAFVVDILRQLCIHIHIEKYIECGLHRI